MHKARPVTLSPTGDARPAAAELSPSTHYGTYFPSRPKTSDGASHLQGRGITRARLPSGDARPRSRRRTATHGRPSHGTFLHPMQLIESRYVSFRSGVNSHCLTALHDETFSLCVPANTSVLVCSCSIYTGPNRYDPRADSQKFDSYTWNVNTRFDCNKKGRDCHFIAYG